MGKLLGRLFVCFTIMLISFNGYSSQIFIIWPWYGREISVDLLKLIVPFKYVSFACSDRMRSWSQQVEAFFWQCYGGIITYA